MMSTPCTVEGTARDSRNLVFSSQYCPSRAAAIARYRLCNMVDSIVRLS